MPLGPSHTSPVGFVLSNGIPRGTCFIVERIDEAYPARSDLYLVTARHVVYQNDGALHANLSVRFREFDSYDYLDGLRDEWPEKRWLTHDDDAIDLAVAPCGRNPRFEIGAISLDDLAYDCHGTEVVLGLPVFYVGLFTAEADLGAIGVPMVRSGTLGAFCQSIKPGTPRRMLAHLIDVRSYAGFSGSPVYVQTDLPDQVDWNEATAATQAISGRNYETWLLGVLIMHYNDLDVPSLEAAPGVAIVVPVDRIWEILNHKDFEDLRISERARLAETPGSAAPLA